MPGQKDLIYLNTYDICKNKNTRLFWIQQGDLRMILLFVHFKLDIFGKYLEADIALDDDKTGA